MKHSIMEAERFFSILDTTLSTLNIDEILSENGIFQPTEKEGF